jgi:peptide deformylase
MIAYIDESFDENSKAKIRRGIAIAAEQVGLDKSVIYIHFNVDDKEVKYLLGNPKIISTSLTNSYLPLGEGCLSVDDEHPGIVKRKSRIVVKAIDLLDNNKDVTIEAAGMLAICLQHEIDHLSGILYYDRINKSDP